ncbi:MAG: molecular chaperone DnaJ [Cyanobacteria bacterium P01_A01_bin.80]
MCNPRRIRVTATRQLNEAWQREVSRTIELQGQVTGEARVRQPLDSTLGSPALRALESALADENSGWTEVEEGYRYDVEGGYVIYLADEQALEIVATLSDEIQVSAQASRTLEGSVNTELSTEGEGRYYDDGWGGRTREVAEQEAEKSAQQKLDEITRSQLEQAENEAEAEVSSEIEAAARTQAENQLQQQSTQRQAVLSNQARENLDTVGVRCRQAFNQVLARAYRDAILAYARRNGADNIQCSEDNNIIDIEFNLHS